MEQRSPTYDFPRSADQAHWELVMSLGILLFFGINFFRQAREQDRQP